MNKFTEEDLAKAKKLVLIAAQEASYSGKLNEMAALINLVNWAQKELVPKIESNILEVKKVIQTKNGKETK